MVLILHIIGFQFKYNDLDGKEQLISAIYNNFDKEDFPITSYVDINKSSIIIKGSPVLKEVRYSFELNNGESKNTTLHLYLHDGHVIEAHFDDSIDSFRKRYENYSSNKYMDLFEAAAYGGNYYDYFVN